MEPLLSVVIIAYNHERYIARSIEGAINQNVSFPYEIIIAEDFSTDATRQICSRYAERYPDIVRIVTSDSNVGGIKNEVRGTQAARGKYVAYCEGDDYWTDPEKLQKQVDFLESHPDYSATFHRYRRYYAATGLWRDDDCGRLFPSGKQESGTDVTKEIFVSKWVTQFLSVVCRRESVMEIIEQDVPHYKLYRDYHFTYHLLEKGKVYLFSFVGGVYNVTGTGNYSQLSEFRTLDVDAKVLEEVWKYKGDVLVRKQLEKNLQDTIDLFRNDRNMRRQLFRKTGFLFLLNKNPFLFVKNIIKLY